MLVTRRWVLRSIAAGGIGAAAGATAHGAIYGRSALELTYATVPVAGLPPALEGLRIGLLTDIHRSEWVSHEAVASAADLLMSVAPDLIVLGGDYISFADRRFVQPAAEALSALAAPFGVYGILGNHDDDRDMPAALTARGVLMLNDARTRITIRSEALEIAGLRFWTRRPADVAGVLRGADTPLILLAHDPRRLIDASALDIPLVLSGHTHGGQVVLPVAGAIAARRFPVVSGVGRRGRSTIFVSRGIGTVYVPIRINCPPEVAVLTLKRATDAPA
jgi:hypothetical protein